MLTGQTLNITLPEYKDLDGDSVTISKLNWGAAQSFITGDYPNFILNPGASYFGDFPVSITLTDDHPSPKSTTASFKITIILAEAHNSN